jgi:hypothetical protein
MKIEVGLLCVDLLCGEEWGSENREALLRGCSRMFKIRIASFWKKTFPNKFSNSTYVLKNNLMLTELTNSLFVGRNSPLVSLCGLVVRVSGYRSRGLGFHSKPHQIFWEVGILERRPLSIVRTIEELLGWKSSGSSLKKTRLTAVGIRCADHATPSTRKGWH